MTHPSRLSPLWDAILAKGESLDDVLYDANTTPDDFTDLCDYWHAKIEFVSVLGDEA